MTNHPNAVVGGASGAGVGTLVVWLLGRYGVSLDAEVAATIAGGISAVVLFIGKNGLRGAWHLVWRGGDGGGDRKA